MLGRTSKRVKEVVDKIRLPDVEHLSRTFWDDTHTGTATESQQFATVLVSFDHIPTMRRCSDCFMRR
jgi:hypothetical protein